MENEPRPNPKKINFIFGELKIEGYKENTKGYVYHDDDAKYDNITIKNLDPDGEPAGWVVFRGDLENFDDVLEFMLDNDFMVEFAAEVSDVDKEIYDMREADRQAKQEALEVMQRAENVELTLRQERLVRFLQYILKTEQLNPSDFDGFGDLYI